MLSLHQKITFLAQPVEPAYNLSAQTSKPELIRCLNPKTSNLGAVKTHSKYNWCLSDYSYSFYVYSLQGPQGSGDNVIYLFFVTYEWAK
jgi:hypothetical protein